MHGESIEEIGIFCNPSIRVEKTETVEEISVVFGCLEGEARGSGGFREMMNLGRIERGLSSVIVHLILLYEILKILCGEDLKLKRCLGVLVLLGRGLL